MIKESIADVLIEHGILVGIYRSACRTNSNRSSIGIEHGFLCCRYFAGIEMAETARGKNPKCGIGILHGANTGNGYEAF